MNVNGTEKDRRKSKRYRLRLPVLFSWRDEHGILQSGEGCSDNISGRGIYVHTKCAPPRGRSLELNVFLPQPSREIRAAEIHAKGHVTRVDQDPRARVYGFAAMNRTVLIREPRGQQLDDRAGTGHDGTAAERIQPKPGIRLNRF